MEQIFETPWPFWLSGAGIGLFVILLAWLSGKPLGVSGGFAQACDAKQRGKDPWKLIFAFGIPLGAFLGALAAGGPNWTYELGFFESEISQSLAVKTGMLFIGGLCIGYGARWAGGCTSGHAIVGVAQGAKSSLIVTAGFMAGGVLVTQALYWLGA
ncbi:MAG: YeeE/YedE thiosulfate transporter family protein [Planctomycetota bacterium]|nr:YeeE/YedE thiosulfate transporter family protein [Planctomycetota bacterium]